MNSEFSNNRENNREFFFGMCEKPHELRLLAKGMHENRELTGNRSLNLLVARGPSTPLRFAQDFGSRLPLALTPAKCLNLARHVRDISKNLCATFTTFTRPLPS